MLAEEKSTAIVLEDLTISTILGERKSTTIVLDDLDVDNWEYNPANPRRWSLTRKWLSMGTVCDFPLLLLYFITFFPLDHALYLCFFIGERHAGPSYAPDCEEIWFVRLFWVCEAYTKHAARYHGFYDSGNDSLDLFPLSRFDPSIHCTAIRDVWPKMGKLNLQLSASVLLRLMLILRSCISAICFKASATWLALMHRIPYLCLRFGSSVGMTVVQLDDITEAML